MNVILIYYRYLLKSYIKDAQNVNQDNLASYLHSHIQLLFQSQILLSGKTVP